MTFSWRSFLGGLPDRVSWDIRRSLAIPRRRGQRPVVKALEDAETFEFRAGALADVEGAAAGVQSSRKA